MTLAFTGVSHWLEPSVAWLGSEENPHGPVLHSTLWSPLSNCCASPGSQAETCSMGRIAPCCVLTLGYGVDETTLSWKSFLLVAHKALPLVSSAVMSASHSKHTEPRREMLSQTSGCCWMMLWMWDFSLNWLCWSQTFEPKTRAGIYGSCHVHFQQALLVLIASADSSLAMLLGRGLLGTEKLMWLTWKSHSKLSLPPESEER